MDELQQLRVQDYPSSIKLDFTPKSGKHHIKEVHDNDNESIPTIEGLCDNVQSLIYDHLAVQYHPHQSKHEYMYIDKHLFGLKAALLKLQQNTFEHQNSETNVSEHEEPEQLTIKKKWSDVPTQTTRPPQSPVSRLMSLRDNPLYRIDSETYCHCSGSLRQDWNTIELEDDDTNWKELKPCWFELFFDLMFVASIVHISSESVLVYDNGHGSFLFTVQVLAQFGLFSLCWIEQVLYQSRFRMNQMIDGILRFVYMALVLTMGLGISDNQISHKSFLISYIFIKFVSILMLTKSSFIPRARNHSIFMISEKIISITATIFILVLVNDVSNTVWLIIFASLFIYSYFHIIVMVYCDCIRYCGVNIPINVPHVAERMGAFVLIILGETIISIMVQHFNANPEEMVVAYLVTMSFFLIVYCAGKLYFESQPTEHDVMNIARSHALSRNNVWNARIYCLVHFILFFGLLGLGIGAKMVTHSIGEHHEPSMEMIFLPGISCIVILIAINIIRLTHPFDYEEHNNILVYSVWCIRVVSIGVMFVVLFVWNSMEQYMILTIYVICFVLQIVIDFEARYRLGEKSKIPSLIHQTTGML